MSEEVCNLEDSIRWLREEASRCLFGEVALKATMHGGLVVRIDQTITTKLTSKSSPAVGKQSRNRIAGLFKKNPEDRNA